MRNCVRSPLWRQQKSASTESGVIYTKHLTTVPQSVKCFSIELQKCAAPGNQFVLILELTIIQILALLKSN
jgi:hypothetical protein